VNNDQTRAIRILAVTDVHDRADVLREIVRSVERVDVIVLGGDLTNRGNSKDAVRILDAGSLGECSGGLRAWEYGSSRVWKDGHRLFQAILMLVE